jgi:hypothetical protein
MQNQQAAQEALLSIGQMSLLGGSLIETIILILQVIFLLILLAAFGYLVYVVKRRGVGSRSPPQGTRSWREYGSLYVVLWGIGAVIIGFGFIGILLALGRFGDGTQALGFLTAYFGAIVGLVGTYFGVKTSADVAEGAQRLVAANGRDTTEPQVTSTTPVDNEKNVSPKIKPTATFSKDMDEVTINEATFKLVIFGGDQADVEPVQPKVRGGVKYDPATKVATFTPAHALQYGKRYGATITSSVKDKAGNALAQDKAWHFTTQEPPEEEQPPPAAAEEEQPPELPRQE